MLIESIPSAKPDEEPNNDGEKVTAWQSELDQFLATTMNRLDSLAEALNEALDETRSSSELTSDLPSIHSEPINDVEPPVIESRDQDGPERNDAEDDTRGGAANNPSLPVPASSTETMEGSSIQGEPASYRLAANEGGGEADGSFETSPQQSEAIGVSGAASDAAPDEAWERLNAIKSRLAKQLENQ